METGRVGGQRLLLPSRAPLSARGHDEARRRRTFAIISHPDAGKTTLTEKFLLYAGAVEQAGAVRSRAGGRQTTSDWMELERQRGISITSTVLQFSYRDCVVNLLDTPGHRDFSEDTYRVLAAADAAVMVLDVAKGVEAQTLKLFEVCRARELPVLIFLNKYDRPGLEPLGLLDEIEEKISLAPAPLTWPVGRPGEFKGVIDRRSGDMIRFDPAIRGSKKSPEERLDPAGASEAFGEEWDRAIEECALLDEIGATYDEDSFLSGHAAPLFVGSALTNFGVRHLLDAVIDLAPSPAARHDSLGASRPLDADFSGFVFKVQANMDKAHRDHIAFVRVCSGRFQRGMSVVHGPSGRALNTKYAMSVFGAERTTVEEAWPGDVIGLVNASELRIGDSVFAGQAVTYPPIPVFAPELIATARPVDVSRHKQFRRGMHQLEREGVVQVLHRPGVESVPVLAAVGQMQFEVVSHRLEHEFGAAVEMSPPEERSVRRTDEDTAAELSRLAGVEVMKRGDGVLLALFNSPYWLERVKGDHPSWTLEAIVGS